MKRFFILAGFFSLFLLMCDDSTNPQPGCSPISDPSKQIEIVYPTANEQLTVGKTINIQWKVKAGLGKVNLKLLDEDGILDEDILSTMLIPSGQDVICMDTNWVVGRISNIKSIEKDTTILLMVHKYGDESTNDFIPIRLKK